MAGLINCVCIVFEQGVKKIILSSMDNLIMECDLNKDSRLPDIPDALNLQRWPL